MKPRLLSIILILAWAATASAQRASPAPPFTITSVKAMLFYDNKGTFSRDVAEDMSEPQLVPSILWNTPIEGASREGAATSVLVTVEVSGEYLGPKTTRSIEFTAKYKSVETSRQIIVRRVTPIRIGESGIYIAGFWLDEAGCDPVMLKARIIGQKKQSIMLKKIRFGCGE
jgi:hypothetical protein